jgi:aspartate racemase
MKQIAGLIAGVGPESTIDYYREIIHEYRSRITDGSYPPLILNSVNLTKLLRLMNTNDLPGVAEYLVEEIDRLVRAGATFGAITANTPHIVFNEVQQRSAIPLLSIVEATCDQAKAMNLKRLALLGTRFTMQSNFYADIFIKEGLNLIVPNEAEQAYIHEKYFSELVLGTFLPETRERLISIADRMKEQEGIEGVILGGTELPLILQEPPPGLVFLDTTKIHVQRIVDRLLS